MNQRTKYFQLRLTPEEYTALKEKSASHTSVSHYIRSAIAEYSNVDARLRLRLLNELGEYYRRHQNELSHISGNLNQSVKRANELSVAGLLSDSYIKEVLTPSILDVQNTLDSLKRELLNVTKKVLKP